MVRRKGNVFVVAIHTVLGLPIVVIAVLLLLWNTLRISNKWRMPSFGRVLIGLLDLQILLGIIAFIIHPIWGLFVLHPITMIAAAAVAHVLVREKNSQQKQLAGYFLATVLLILGVYFANRLV